MDLRKGQKTGAAFLAGLLAAGIVAAPVSIMASPLEETFRGENYASGLSAAEVASEAGTDSALDSFVEEEAVFDFSEEGSYLYRFGEESTSANLFAGEGAQHEPEYFTTYYQQLTKEEKGFYDYIDAQEDLRGFSYDADMPSSERVYVSYALPEEEYITIPCTREEFDSRAYRQTADYQGFYVSKVKAYDCWLKDHPVFFWSNGINTITRLKYDADHQTATIRQIDFCVRRYYKGVLDEIEEVNTALDRMLSDVEERLGGDVSPYHVAYTAEKYINELMYYDSPAAISSDTSVYGYAHTITGPLLDKYGHKGVCESYSKLFKIICDAFGAKSIIVIGKSYSSLQNMDHMWNYILMEDGQWYMVDCTFDDSSTGMTWFLSGLDSGITVNNHVPVGRFSTGIMYKEVEYPTLAAASYKDQRPDDPTPGPDDPTPGPDDPTPGPDDPTPGPDDPDDPVPVINQDVWDFVGRLYRLVLGRDPDEFGHQEWYDSLMSGDESGASVAFGFVFSEEYVQKETSDEEYIRMLYQTMMNREADQTGLNSWKNLLRQGFSRKKILEGFTRSAEFGIVCEDYGIEVGTYLSDEFLDRNSQITMFVARLYLICLQREVIDQAGQISWVAAIVSGASGRTVAKNFFLSNEFLLADHPDDEFVVLLYRTIMNRDPDAEGMQNWLRALSGGASRENVIWGFVFAPEFSLLCEQYGITP